jgi:hypothetical protein
LRGKTLHHALEGHLAKYKKLVPSLALIWHLASGGKGRVSAEAVTKALAWAEYLEGHAVRIYGSVTQPAVDAANAIIGKIKSGKLGNANAEGIICFKKRDITGRGWSGLMDRGEVERALDLLNERAWLEVEDIKPGNLGGRPTTLFKLNPKVKL